MHKDPLILLGIVCNFKWSTAVTCDICYQYMWTDSASTCTKWNLPFWIAGLIHYLLSTGESLVSAAAFFQPSQSHKWKIGAINNLVIEWCASIFHWVCIQFGAIWVHSWAHGWTSEFHLSSCSILCLYIKLTHHPTY